MATKKKATKPADSVQEAKEEKELCTFGNALGIKYLLDNFKEPTRSDRKKLDAYEGFLNEVTQEFEERKRKVFEFYDIGEEGVSPDNPKFNEITQKLNTIAGEKSSFEIDKFQQFTEDELDRFTDGLGLPRGERKHLHHWLVKPDKD